MKRQPTTIVFDVPDEAWLDRPVLVALAGLVGAGVFFMLGWLFALIGVALGVM